MRRDHRRPFDIEADEATDVTQQFWGTTRGWAPLGDDQDQIVDDRTSRSLQSLKSSIAGMRRRPWQPVRRSDASGRMDRTRSHGIPRPAPAEDVQTGRHEATLGQLAAGWIDDEDWPELDLAPTRPHHVVPSRRPDDRLQDAFDEVDEFDEFDAYPEDLDDDVIPLSPVAPLASKLGLGAVDPLLARLGAIVVAGVLLLPVAMSARGGSHDALADASEAIPAAVPASVAGSVAATLAPAAAQISGVASTSAAAANTLAASDAAGVVVTASASGVTSAPATTAAAPTAYAQPQVAAATTTPAADVPQSVSATTNTPAEVATVSEPADRVAPDCSLTYEAGQGDSWYRIADAAGVTPRALMDQNLAGLETTIFPGDEICLPEGATVPAKPVVTTSPPATSAPTTAPPTTIKPTTTTTVKPTTTTAPPPAPVSTADVQALIREIWPDELEERALQIAYRESNYKSSAYNGSCCYGVFQINWSSHRSWLGAYGITSTNDLLDARKNITAAYALYQRSGGWGPWGG